MIHVHPLFAIVVIPVLLGAMLVAAPWLPGEGQPGGVWFLSANGRRLALGAASLGMLLTTIGILCSEFCAGPAQWWPEARPVFGQGLLPFLVVAGVVTGIYWLCRLRFRATQGEAVQAIFVLLASAFIVLTVTGTWFRGEGMTLVLPWLT